MRDSGSAIRDQRSPAGRPFAADPVDGLLPDVTPLQRQTVPDADSYQVSATTFDLLARHLDRFRRMWSIAGPKTAPRSMNATALARAMAGRDNLWT